MKRFFFALIFLFPLFSFATEFEGSFDLFSRYNFNNNFLREEILYNIYSKKLLFDQYLTPIDDTHYPSFFIRAEGEFLFSSQFSFNFNIDSGEIRYEDVWKTKYFSDGGGILTSEKERKLSVNGHSFTEEAEDTFFIRELFFRLNSGINDWFSIEYGKKFFDIGRSYIFNDIGYGIEILLDYDTGFCFPFKTGIKFLLPARDFYFSEGVNPLGEFFVSFPSGFSNEVKIFFSYFHDGYSHIAEILRASVVEDAIIKKKPYVYYVGSNIPMESRGNIFWTGVDAEFSFSPSLSLSSIFIWTSGAFDVVIKPDKKNIREIKMDTSGYAGEIAFSYLPSSKGGLDLFFLFLSGDEGVSKKTDVKITYNSFLSVMPYITRSNIFFFGGLNESFSTRRISTSGINGRGVIAFGDTIYAIPYEWLEFNINSVHLFSMEESPLNGEKYYGFENDFMVFFYPLENIVLSFEFDVLLPGSFFSHQNPITKFVAGLDISFQW